MVEKYNPKIDKRFKTTDAPGTTGEALYMAERAGAQLVNMGYIQTYPICDPISGAIELIADARFDGAIMLNQEGKRFVEELQRRDVLSEAILNQTGRYCWVLWNDKIGSISNTVKAHANEYEAFTKQGIMTTCDDLKCIADFTKIPFDQLRKTVKRVSDMAGKGNDKDFNHRSGLVDMQQGKYYVIKAVPSTHHTMGGVRINEKAEALTAEGKVIPGLWAAGEVTGVTHGTNRLGGNAYTDIIVFGRIAGKPPPRLRSNSRKGSFRVPCLLSGTLIKVSGPRQSPARAVVHMRRPPGKPLRRARFNASGRKIGSVTTIYLHFRQAFPMSSEKALRTRAAIIAAARGIIPKEGIGALTMDRAAQAAGMSKGACMYHFKNKRALHAALIEDYAAHLDGQMKRHEALFEGRPDETLVPGSVEWFKTFEADSRDWADVGVALLSNFVHDDELMKPVHDWYQKLWFRIQAPRSGSACPIRGHHGARGLLLYSQVRRQSALCGTQRAGLRLHQRKARGRGRRQKNEGRRLIHVFLLYALLHPWPGAPASGRLRCAFCASRRMRTDFAVSPLRFFQGAVHDCHDRTFLS